MAGHHVAGKTDGMADRAHEVADDLDQRQHRAQRQRRARPRTARKCAPCSTKPSDGDGQEHRQRQHRRDGDVRGGVKAIGIRPSTFANRMNRNTVMM
jgi:hypothetical protein